MLVPIFNHGHHNWVIAQVRIGKDGKIELVAFFDQVYLQNAEVSTMCTAFADKMKQYNFKEEDVLFTGDYSGRNHSALSTYTAWEQIEQAFPKSQFEYFRQPAVASRLIVVNSYLLNAKHEQRMVTSDKTRELNKDLRYVTRTQLFKQTKDGDRSHASDAAGYLLWWLDKIK
jgi:1,2-phenylacetyl-CoA epoxidase PaaB subunit